MSQDWGEIGCRYVMMQIIRVWVGVYLLACKNSCSWPYGSNTCERSGRRTTTFWPLIARLQRLNSKWIWNAINQVISLIGTRVYVFQSVKHFWCTLTLASWVLSQADLFLLRLTISPHPTLFLKKKSCCPYHSLLSSWLLFLSLCWGCLFSLSIDLYSSTMSVVERSSVLLRCSVNPLCKCKQQKSSMSGRFLYFPFKVSVLCILHIESIYIIQKVKIERKCLQMKQHRCIFIPNQHKVRRRLPEIEQINVDSCD